MSGVNQNDLTDACALNYPKTRGLLLLITINERCEKGLFAKRKKHTINIHKTQRPRLKSSLN
jgi:hypothetical protein